MVYCGSYRAFVEARGINSTGDRARTVCKLPMGFKNFANAVTQNQYYMIIECDPYKSVKRKKCINVWRDDAL